VDAVDPIQAGETGLTSRLTGSEVFRASFGGQSFRYPPAVALLSSLLLRTGYGLFRRSAAGGKVIALAKRLMRGGVQ
jgi:hypothetical protein